MEMRYDTAIRVNTEGLHNFVVAKFQSNWYLENYEIQNAAFSYLPGPYEDELKDIKKQIPDLAVASLMLQGRQGDLADNLIRNLLNDNNDLIRTYEQAIVAGSKQLLLPYSTGGFIYLMSGSGFRVEPKKQLITRRVERIRISR